MDTDALQSLIEQNASRTGQDIAQLPNVANDTRQTLFGQDPTLASLQSNEASKIQELYSHDQNLSQQYGGSVQQPNQTPAPTAMASSAPTSTGAPGTLQPNVSNPAFGAQNPQAAGYILNPYYAENFKATQDKATAGELSDLQGETQKRRDVLGNVLDNLLKVYQSHIDQEKYLSDTYQKELDTKMAQKDSNLKNLLDVLKISGGTVPDDVSKQLGLPSGTYIPPAASTSTRGIRQQAMNNLIGDLQGNGGPKTGMTLGDALTTYAGNDGVTAQDVYDKYNQINNDIYRKKNYGPATETPENLAVNGIKVPKEYADQQSAIAGDQALYDSAQKIRDALLKSPVLFRAIPGMQHLDPNVATAQSELFQNITDLKKAIGGRVTQKELFTWLETNFPVGKDLSPDVMNAKIGVLRDKLNTALKQEGAAPIQEGTPNNTTSGNNTGSTIMTGTDGKQYNVPNAKVKEAQSHGWK